MSSSLLRPCPAAKTLLNTWYRNSGTIGDRDDPSHLPSPSSWVQELMSSPFLTPISIRQRESGNIILIFWHACLTIHPDGRIGVFFPFTSSSSSQTITEYLIPHFWHYWRSWWPLPSSLPIQLGSRVNVFSLSDSLLHQTKRKWKHYTDILKLLPHNPSRWKDWCLVPCDLLYQQPQKKSRIRETKHLSTDADSSTDSTVGWTKNTRKPNFFEKRKKSSKTQKLKNV